MRPPPHRAITCRSRSRAVSCDARWSTAQPTRRTQNETEEAGKLGEHCSMPDTSIKDFEAAIAELESIVKKLEEGDLALEQSLALYERGVQLSRFCHARLEDAERRIEILNERGELKRGPPPPPADASRDA